MKLKNLFFTGLAGIGAYQLYQNRHAIKASLTQSKKAITASQADIDNIKKNLETINKQRQHLSKISQDLTYKFRVFNQEAQAHLTEINKIADKYKDGKKK